MPSTGGLHPTCVSPELTNQNKMQKIQICVADDITLRSVGIKIDVISPDKTWLKMSRNYLDNCTGFKVGCNAVPVKQNLLRT